MATGLQVKNLTQIISGGFNGERHGFTGAGYNDWTDVPLSGSVTLSYYYADSDSGTNANSSCVYVTIKDSWNTTKDAATNKLTIQVTTQLVSVTRGSVVGSPGGTGRFMWAHPDKGTSAVWTGIGYPNQAATYLSSPGITLSTRTIVLNPESSAGKGTIYYKGGMVGHEGDATPSIYVDEFWMGTQFRNVLPDKPPKPTVAVASQTPVDCQTLTATINITQGRYGDYGTETSYARHKIGDGNWTNYVRVSTQRLGVYTIENIEPNTQVQVEAYSTGDGTESDHQVITFTTPPRPVPATLSFASQTAESNQLTLRANINYAQTLNPSHTTTTTYARYGYKLTKQLLRDEGYGHPTPDPSWWYSVSSDTSIQYGGDGWGHVEVAPRTSGSSAWVNTFMNRGAIDNPKPDTDYTILVEWMNRTNIASCTLIQDRQIELFGRTPKNVNFNGQTSGRDVIHVKTWPNINPVTMDLRVFYNMQNVTQPASIDMRITVFEGNYDDLEWQPYLSELTDWKAVATNSASGAFTIRNLDPSREVVVETYSVGDGICSGSQKQTTFFTPTPIAKPVHGSFAQTDTGTCINVTLPWTQPDATRFNTVHTYYSYHVDNTTWTDWAEFSNPTSDTASITCVPYGSTICVRSYSVGDGLKGETNATCIRVSDKPTDDRPYEGDTFVNPPVCNSLQYLAELICQEWYAIKDGDRIVYTNEEHKRHCDGDEDDPTLHSMLSRIYRFFGAIVCLTCDGANNDFNHFKQGPHQTVLVSAGDGEYADWVAPDMAVTEDSTNVVTSGGIWEAIDEFVHTAYYYIGDYDYLTLNPSTLESVKYAEAGDTALVKNGAGGTDQEYSFDGTNWTAGAVKHLDDFDMVHVNKESTFMSGFITVVIPAGSAWYWYNSNWNHLDASSDAMQEEVSELLDANMVMKQDTNEEDMQFSMLSRNPDGTVTAPIRPTAKTIYFVTEEI